MTLLQAASSNRVAEEGRIPNLNAVLHFRRELLCEISPFIRRYKIMRGEGTPHQFIIIKTNVALSHRRRLLLGGSDARILESFIDTFDKTFVVKRLVQDSEGPTVQNPSADLFIEIGCHKNHRRAQTIGNQPILQVNSAHAWHLQIRDHAG